MGRGVGERADMTKDPEEVLIYYPTSGAPKRWGLTRAKANEYWRLYGKQIDILMESRKAKQWLVDNPTRRKTAKGMPRFLNNWYSRAVDSGRGTPPLSKRESQAQAERMRRAAIADEDQAKRAHDASRRNENEPQRFGEIIEFPRKENSA